MPRKKQTDAPMSFPNAQQIKYWQSKGYVYIDKNIFKNNNGDISIFRIDQDKRSSMFTDLSKNSNNIEKNVIKNPIEVPIKMRKERADKGKKRGPRK